jgi:hypothetical protein
MTTDYKTTTTYFIFLLAFIYSIYVENTGLVGIVVFPLMAMWLVLKTDSKELVKEIVEAYNKRKER